MLFRRYDLNRIIEQLLELLKRLHFTAHLATKKMMALAISTAKVISLKPKCIDFSYNSNLPLARDIRNQRLLRKRSSHSCSPKLLLLLQFFWILPYILLTNHLESSLLPFRLMCYVDPDFLSVQRSLRIDSQHCIRQFFTTRQKPTYCRLNKPINTLILPKSLHTSIKQRVLVVRSAPRHNSYRNYIRSTWKRDVEPEIPVIFVSGRDNYDLHAESAENDDILQLDFVDSYQNLTMKMMGIYRYFIETTSVEQIVVINDDTIVNATGLRKVFNQAVRANNYDGSGEYEDFSKYTSIENGKWRKKKPQLQYLMGKVSRGYPRLFFPWLPWYVSSQAYPHKCYPPFVQGSSFVISRSAAEKILDRICDFPSIHLDDVMMGIVTNCLNIQNLHHEGFDQHLLDNFIVFHYQFSRHSAETMYNLYYKSKDFL